MNYEITFIFICNIKLVSMEWKLINLAIKLYGIVEKIV